MVDYSVVDPSGVIVNNIVLDDGMEWQPPEGCTVVENVGGYEIGGTLINDVYTAPVHEVPPPILPTSATKLGIKRAFDEIGMWAQVKAAIAADPDAQEEWDLAIEIKESDPLTQKLIAALQFTPEQVSQIIVRANTLV